MHDHTNVEGIRMPYGMSITVSQYLDDLVLACMHANPEGVSAKDIAMFARKSFTQKHIHGHVSLTHGRIGVRLHNLKERGLVHKAGKLLLPVWNKEVTIWKETHK